jgi:hypothetical protein
MGRVRTPEQIKPPPRPKVSITHLIKQDRNLSSQLRGVGKRIKQADQKINQLRADVSESYLNQSVFKKLKKLIELSSQSGRAKALEKYIIDRADDVIGSWDLTRLPKRLRDTRGLGDAIRTWDRHRDGFKEIYKVFGEEAAQ